jgi:23S rRNA (uracil1939-C5)-methyltransferase
VARLDGRSVFVPGALPGERVRAAVIGPAHAQLLEVLVPSPARRVPACPLADRCGGCDWMHLEEASQRSEKERIVVSTLQHLGGIEPESYALAPTAASPASLGYRRRAVLHPVGKRLGFFGRGSHERVEVERCPALTPPLERLPGILADALGSALKGVETVQVLECGGEVAVSLHLGAPARPRQRQALEALIREGLLAGAVLVPERGAGAPERCGAPELLEGGVWHRPDGFAQANAALNRELVAAAVALLEVAPTHAVLELYAGNGNFTFPLAARAARVVAVEASSVSVQLAQRGAQALGASPLRLVQGDCAAIAEGLVGEGARFDRLLLDPPRTGAPGVARWAARLLVERVVYVACDPAALARDAAALADAGYRPETLQVFDLFPQTHHVEAVMAFARGPA